MPEFKWDFPVETANAGIEGINAGTGLIFQGNPLVSLAREAIQNSLDARDHDKKDEPVIVEISFDYIPRDQLPGFDELKKHFEGIQGEPETKESEYRENLINSMPKDGKLTIPAMKIRDINTIGMNYNPDPKVAKAPALNAFLATGVNSKDNTQANGGSRGWGKGVFYAISPMKTVLVSTYSKIDEKEYFIGKASFCHHFIGDKHYRNFGVYSDNGQDPTNNIPERFKRNGLGYGTDIYVLGATCDDLYTRKEIIRNVIQNYWCAIAKGELKVVIKGNGKPEVKTFTIDNTTLPKIISGKDSTLGSLFKDIDKSSVKRKDLYEPKPYYEAYEKAEASINNEGIKEFYKFRKELPILGECIFYLVKNKEIGRSKVTYMRKTHMTIKTENNTTQSSGFYGVFICDNVRGNQILTDMEGPAHDEWTPEIVAAQASANASQVKEKAKKVLEEIESFINDCLGQVFDYSASVESALPGLKLGYELNDSNNDDNLDDGENPGNGRWAILKVVNKTPRTSNPGHDGPTVVIDVPVIKDPQGEITAGVDHHGDGPNPGPNPTPGERDKYTKDPNGKKASGYKKFKAQIRVYPSVIDGKNYNMVLLKPLEDVEQAHIEISVATDADSMNLDIEKCTVDGTTHNIEKNALDLTNLKKDKTYRIALLFDDNMIHTLKIGS